MSKYNFRKIEKKWQTKWDKSELYKAKDFSNDPKYYCLIEFPYPSGAGLHVGHLRSHIAIDIVARKKRMSGYNVIYPIGWDAFGLPTENFAIKTKTHPTIVTKKNIKTFTKQIKSYGPSFDWSREINTTDPKYYKWTQWIFLKLFNSFYDERSDKARPIEELDVPAGLDALGKKEYIDSRRLAYEAEMAINWCPSCKIGLANEEVMDGSCERCGAVAEKRTKRQWMLRITKYAQRLIDDLNSVDYLDKIKTQQINWIGKSEGATVKFKVKSEKLKDNARIQYSPLERGEGRVANNVEVFTTRIDTIFGCTYVVLAPEHPLIETLKTQINNYDEVLKYINEAKNKPDLDRTDLAKEKTGVEIKGLKVINPFNNEEIPVWVADYVLGAYGTGAVMAVPAHDERDFVFAKKYALPIKVVVVPAALTIVVSGSESPEIAIQKERDAFLKGEKSYCDDGQLVNSEKYSNLRSEQARNEMIKSLEEKSIGQKKVNYKLRDWVFSRQHYWGEPIPIIKCKHCGLAGINVKMELNFRDNNVWNQIIGKKKTIETRALNPDEKERYFGDIKAGDILKFNNKNTGDFEVVRIKKVYNFGGLGELYSNKDLISRILPGAKIKSINDLEKSYGFTNDYIGRIKNNGLVGWEFQVLNITKNIPLNESDLPLELPNVKNYEPTDTGESPLANITKWVSIKCPVCKNDARRETDTMPNWAGSSWYFLRYLDPRNDKQFASRKKIDYWMPVDLYNGGMEHTTLHLLYSRFWHKFLFDLGYVNTSEPYKTRRSHGMILAEDGQKMSKSRGNVVNPDDVIEKYGADTIRLYEMFMGPYGESIPWSTTSLIGMHRFLERIWNLQFKVQNADIAFSKPVKNTILVATNNQGKLSELKDHFKDFNIICIADLKKKYKEPVENGKTYEDNSLIKAKYYAKKTGYITVADDSGFSVAAMDGKPGVFSARFAKGDYKQAQGQIIGELSDKNDRSAYFKSVITMYDPKNDTFRQFDGVCKGFVSQMAKGNGGFGYDPIFIPEAESKTFGEMPNVEKYKYDHRKKAVSKLIAFLDSEHNKSKADMLPVLHRAIKKVTEDVDNMKFNTAISQIMILSNEYDRLSSIPRNEFSTIITMLAPFVPHITEEMWLNLGGTDSIHLEKWPKYDESTARETEIELVVQINGKVREKLSAPAGISEDEAKKLALASDKVRKWVEGKEIKKFLFIKGRLINIVV
ncbi:MAG: RdgB/HAM1 family non-canonical purine NTP pyrophosphatase [Candidatus Paceibacterota bacterium]|jgi:non-canonical purine NTP pyrophosphatase (RdgB/HAM1 family)